MSDTDTTVATPVETPAEEKGKTRQMSFTVLDSGVIRAEFGPGLDPVDLDPATVPENVLSAATIEGLISRARGYSSRLEGADRTPAALREVTEKAFSNLVAGIWKIERTGAGSAEFSIEVEAAWVFRKMREATGGAPAGTLEQTAENFAKLTEEQRTELKALPRYKAAYSQVKAERAAKKAAADLAKAEKAEENIDF